MFLLPSSKVQTSFFLVAKDDEISDSESIHWRSMPNPLTSRISLANLVLAPYSRHSIQKSPLLSSTALSRSWKFSYMARRSDEGWLLGLSRSADAKVTLVLYGLWEDLRTRYFLGYWKCDDRIRYKNSMDQAKGNNIPKRFILCY